MTCRNVIHLSDYRRPRLRVVPIEERGPTMEERYTELEKLGEAVNKASATVLASVIGFWLGRNEK